MSKLNKVHRKQKHILLVLFIIGITLSVFGYILRGTVNAPANHTTEGVGVLIGLLSGIVLIAWFCLAIANLLKMLKNKHIKFK